jgi:thiol-disulfide isomerase/thioredoxin
MNACRARPTRGPHEDPLARRCGASQAQSRPMIVYPHRESTDWTVVCLCAEWCGTCRDYRPVFAARAASADDAVHLWVDIEDDADALGDLDIETFPTVLVLQGDLPRFLGPVLPQPGVVDALLRSLEATERRAIAIAAENAEAVHWLALQARRVRAVA